MGPDDFSIASVEGLDGHLVKVAGELDLANAPALGRHLARLTGYVTVDLADVSFIDCAALRVLIVAHRDAAARGDCLTIGGASAVCARVFAVTGLEWLLDMTPTTITSGTVSRLASPLPRTQACDPATRRAG